MKWPLQNHILPVKKINSISKSDEALKKTRALAFFHILLCILRNHSEWVIHKFTVAHASTHMEGVSALGMFALNVQVANHYTEQNALQLKLFWELELCAVKYRNTRIWPLLTHVSVTQCLETSCDLKTTSGCKPLCLFANCHVNELLTRDWEESVSDYTAERWKLWQWAW